MDILQKIIKIDVEIKLLQDKHKLILSMTVKSVPQKTLKEILYSAGRKSKKEGRARRKEEQEGRTQEKRQLMKTTDE